MDDIFNQFRDNLEGRPEPKFDKSDWQDMQARLNPETTKRPTAIVWWFALPFMLLLTGSNAFFFWQWKNAERKVANLEIRHDTVFHTQVIYTTDTIYRTRVIRERVVEYQTSYALGKNHSIGQNTERPQAMQNTALTATSPAGDKSKTDAISTLQNMALTELNTVAKKAPSKALEPLLVKIKPLHFQREQAKPPMAEIIVPVVKHKKTLYAHIYSARPKAFQVGLTGGLAYPFGSGLDFKSGYSLGVHAAVEFSPKLRLWAEAAYFKTIFLTSRMGDDIGVPVETPPSIDYTFLQAEVPQPFLQYSAGMQYLFRSKHRFKPFLGVGMGAISLLPYDVIYEFKDQNSSVEWDLDRPVHRQGMITNFLVLPVGFEHSFSKHWNMQIQATYRHKWKGTGVQSPNMLGIQSGLNYRF